MSIENHMTLSDLDDKIIDSLNNNLEQGIKLIYSHYQNEFLAWLNSNYSVSHEESEEIFQASLLSLIENLKSGKINHFTSSLKTYLFSIGKYKCLDYLKKKKKYTSFSFEQFVFYDDSEDQLFQKEDFETKFNKVLKILRKLGPPCYTLFSLFYFERKNWDEIASEMGYQTSHSARNMKYKCILKVQKLISSE